MKWVNPLAQELAQTRAPDTCRHCSREVWFDPELELWVANVAEAEGIECGARPVPWHGHED